jgi:WD40 repeat protein
VNPTPAQRELLDGLLASGELSAEQAAAVWSEAQRSGVSLEALLSSLDDGPRRGGALLLSESFIKMPKTSSHSMEGLPAELLAAINDPSRPRMGRYVLLGELGRGAMGVVHRAYDPELRREVAIKQLLNLGEDSTPERERRLKRFQIEGRATARLRHPNIVAVHEVGSEGGRPYLVMDYVKGECFEDLLTHQDLSTRRIVEIMAGVARGLGHAHAAGVLHRDVKPGNVIVDEGGSAKLADFGLARDADAGQGLTRTGQILGTPLFLSPEQAIGKNSATGPTSDVFALGGVLYYALTGQPPFPAEGLMELVHKILDEDPTPPSELAPQVGRDLETIVLTCLAKEPKRRYSDGDVVAKELERFLRGEAIQARPLTGIERFQRAARRNRALSAVVVVSLLLVGALLAAGAAGALYSVQRIQDERDEARTQRDSAEDARRAAETAQEAALSAGERARVAESLAKLETERARREGRAKGRFLSRSLAEKGARLSLELRDGEASAVFAASLALEENEPARSGLIASLGRLVPLQRPRWAAQVTGVAFVGAEQLLWADDNGGLRLSPTKGTTVSWKAHSVGVSAVAAAVDGRFASGSERGELVLWAKPKEAALKAKCGGEGRVVALAFRPDGQALAVASEQGVWLWDLAGSPRRIAECEARAVAWTPNGGQLLAGSASGRILRFDAGGAELGAWSGHSTWVTDLAFDEQARLYSSGLDGRVRRWSGAGECEVELVAHGPVTAITPLHDAEGGMALATSRGSLELWRGQVLRRRSLHSYHQDLIYDLDCSPDGSRLVSAGADHQLGVLLLEGERPEPVSIASPVLAIALSPSGKRIAIGSWLGELLVVNLANGGLHTIDLGSPVRSLCFWTEDELVVGSGEGPIQVCDLTQPRRKFLRGHTGFVSELSRQGGLLVSAGGDGSVRWWDVTRAKEIKRVNLGAPVKGIDLSPQGLVAAVLEKRGLVVLHKGKILAKLDQVAVARWLSDGRGLLVARGRNVLRWNLRNEPKILDPSASDITGMVVRGKTLVTASADGVYTVLDLGRRLRRTRLGGARSTGSMGLALGGGGTILTGPGPRGALCVWDLSGGGLFSALNVGGEPQQLHRLPGGLLLWGGAEGRLEVWDLERERRVRRLVGHKATITRIAVDAQGWIASGDRLGVVHLWPPNEEVPRHTLRAEQTVRGLALRGESLVLVSAGGRTEVWQPGKGEQEEWRALPSESANALAPGWRAVGGTQGRILLQRSGEAPEELRTSRAHGVVALRAGPLGRYLAACTVGIPLPEYLRVAGGSVEAFREVISRNPHTELRLWDTQRRSGFLVHRRRGLRSHLAFSPDGRLLADGGDEIALNDVGRAARLAVLPTPAPSRVQLPVCFTSNQQLVTTYGPKSLAVWDLEATGVLSTPQELVDRVFAATGYRVVATEALVVRTEFEAELRRAASGR